MDKTKAQEQRKEISRSVNYQINAIINPRTLWMGASVTFCGTAAAAVNHSIDLIVATLCLMFCILAQVCGNAAHLYSESLNNRGHNLHEYSNELGLPLMRIYRNAAIASGLMSVMTGLMLMAIAGWWLILFGAATAICVYVSYLAPAPACRTPWNLLLTFLLFGPIGVFGTCYAQLPRALSDFQDPKYLWPCFFISLLMGLYAVSYLIMYHYVNWRQDILNSRKVLSMHLGLRNMRRLYLCVGILSTLVLLTMALTGIPHKEATIIILVALALINLIYRIYLYVRMRVSRRTFLGEMSRVADIIVAATTFIIMVVSIYDAYDSLSPVFGF